MLKRILLCGARRSASIRNPFLNIFQVHFPTRQSDAKRYFTLAVVVLLAMVAFGQESTQTPGQGGLCSACWRVPWPQTTPSTQSDSIPQVDVPPITREYSGSGGSSWNPFNFPGSGWQLDTPGTPAQQAQMRQEFSNIWKPGALAKWGGPAGYGLQVASGLMNLMCGPIGCGLLATTYGPELPGAGEAPWSETDVIFGLDPDGARQLKTFQQEVGGGGGKRIVQIWNGKGDVGHVIDQEIRVRADYGAPGNIRFNLDGIEGLTDEHGAYGPNAPIWNLGAQEAKYGTATTAWELLGVKVRWRTGGLNYGNTTFFLKGKPTSAPW